MHKTKLLRNATALRNPGLAGAKELSRDSSGCWMEGYSRNSANLGIAINILAELWGFRDGIMLALELNIQFLDIEVDCLDIISLMKSSTLSNHNNHCLQYNC